MDTAVHGAATAEPIGPSIEYSLAASASFSPPARVVADIAAPDGRASEQTPGVTFGWKAREEVRQWRELDRSVDRHRDRRRDSCPARHAAPGNHERSHAEGHWPQARGHSRCRALWPGLIVPPEQDLALGNAIAARGISLLHRSHRDSASRRASPQDEARLRR